MMLPRAEICQHALEVEKEELTSSGLKFAFRGTFASENKCLCLSAGIGAVI